MATNWSRFIRDSDMSESLMEQRENELALQFADKVDWDSSRSMARDPLEILIELETEMEISIVVSVMLTPKKGK